MRCQNVLPGRYIQIVDCLLCLWYLSLAAHVHGDYGGDMSVEHLVGSAELVLVSFFAFAALLGGGRSGGGRVLSRNIAAISASARSHEPLSTDRAIQARAAGGGSKGRAVGGASRKEI